jgi:hypothetical protein
LNVECREARNLLTAYTPAPISPAYDLNQFAGGYTPPQISHAYGFDQLPPGLD